MGCYDIETAIAEYEAGLRGMPAIACPSDLSFEQLTNLFEILNSAFTYNGGSGSAPLLIVKAFISCVFHSWSSDVECEPNLDPKLSESRATLEAATYGYRFIVGNSYIDGGESRSTESMGLHYYAYMLTTVLCLQSLQP